MARSDDARDNGARNRVREGILQAVETQIRNGTPRETKLTLDRLLAEGHTSDAAMKLIGSVMIIELNAMLRDGRSFDEAVYAAMLQALPKLPWAEAGDDEGND